VSDETSLGGPQAAFQDTLWSTVLRAKDDGSALGRLIERNWKPLYFYLRRKGKNVDAAKDLTQSFFEHLLEKRLLHRVEQGRGRFRGFLIAALEHFLANEYRIAAAEKHGGGRVRLDFDAAESEYAPTLAETAEDLYNRAWALSILREALEALRGELGDRFEAVRVHLFVEKERPSYRETAQKLGVGEYDVANLLHKARARLGALILERVRETVEGDPHEEAAELLRALSRK